MDTRPNPSASRPPLFAAVSKFREARRQNADRLTTEKALAEIHRVIDGMTTGPLLREAALLADSAHIAITLARALACDRLATLVVEHYFVNGGMDVYDDIDRHAVPLSKKIEALVKHVSQLEQETDKCHQRERMSRPLINR